MNKRVFTGLIVLMGFSIIGIILVQLFWIGNAIKVKNELFDRSVVEALDYTTGRLETMQDVEVINDISFDDSICAVPFDENSHTNHSESIKILTGRNKVIAQNFKLFINGNNHGTYYNTTDKDSDDEVQITTQIEDIDAIYQDGIAQVDSVVSALGDVNIIISDVGKKVKEKAIRLKKVAHKVVTEMYSVENKNLDVEEMSRLFQEKLLEKNIPIGFKLGIIKDSAITVCSEDADSVRLLSSKFKTSLYPNNIIRKNMMLSVYFPEKDSYIYRTISWLLIISLGLSIVVLGTFAVSIFYILKQKKVSEMKSDFINNMTHEFKTPIATIAVAADSISNERVINDPGKIKYFLGMIKKENTRMDHQVEDILTIARLDKKEFEFKWEKHNIQNLVEDAVDGILLQVESREGRIETSFQCENPVATCDKSHFTNVIYNLLDNAMKYSIGAPMIHINCKNTEHGILVSVEDKGIGMSKTVQSKIFERFYRQSSGNIHNVKGFGLGLSYAKAVVEANKGAITVKSEPGKGSQFDVFIPFTRE